MTSLCSLLSQSLSLQKPDQDMSTSSFSNTIKPAGDIARPRTRRRSSSISMADVPASMSFGQILEPNTASTDLGALLLSSESGGRVVLKEESSNNGARGGVLIREVLCENKLYKFPRYDNNLAMTLLSLPELPLTMFIPFRSDIERATAHRGRSRTRGRRYDTNQTRPRARSTAVRMRSPSKLNPEAAAFLCSEEGWELLNGNHAESSTNGQEAGSGDDKI